MFPSHDKKILCFPVTIEKAIDEGINALQDIMKSLFIEGFANGGEGKFAVKKEDLIELPVEIINYVVDQLIGKPNPN